MLSLLPAGEYTVTVKATGFQTLTQARVIVDALDDRGVGTQAANRRLHPVGHGGGRALHAEDGRCRARRIDPEQGLRFAAAGDECQSRAIPSAFAGLVVGVNNYSTQPAGPSTGSFNGGQTYQNEVYIEGLPLTNAGTESDTRNLAFGISVEAVEQFQVETTGAKAMYEGQGVANYVLEVGRQPVPRRRLTNISATPIFDARGFFPPTTPVEHQNEFGATIGGPIKKNKMFFFGNYDGYRYRLGNRSRVPIDPDDGRADGRFQRVPADHLRPHQRHGHRRRGRRSRAISIPANRISPISQSLASYLPGSDQRRNPEQLPGRACRR